jgi:hypothetical protein
MFRASTDGGKTFGDKINLTLLELIQLMLR